MPACIAPGATAEVKRFTLSSLAISFYQLPRPVAEMAVDLLGFWKDFKGAIADSLNQVELYEVVVESVSVLDPIFGADEPRLWISFKVRAMNDTAVTYWLSSQQALTKARLQASLHTRVPGMQISSMVLSPPRLAIQYASKTTIVKIQEERKFVDRLLSTEDQDAATVLLGCLVGIFFGLAALALMCRGGFVPTCLRKRSREGDYNPDDNPDFNPNTSPAQSPRQPLGSGTPIAALADRVDGRGQITPSGTPSGQMSVMGPGFFSPAGGSPADRPRPPPIASPSSAGADDPQPAAGNRFLPWGR